MLGAVCSAGLTAFQISALADRRSAITSPRPCSDTRSSRGK